jgi:hypothetical protein
MYFLSHAYMTISIFFPIIKTRHTLIRYTNMNKPLLYTLNLIFTLSLVACGNNSNNTKQPKKKITVIEAGCKGILTEANAKKSIYCPTSIRQNPANNRKSGDYKLIITTRNKSKAIPTNNWDTPNPELIPETGTNMFRGATYNEKTQTLTCQYSYNLPGGSTSNDPIYVSLKTQVKEPRQPCKKPTYYKSQWKLNQEKTRYVCESDSPARCPTNLAD